MARSIGNGHLLYTYFSIFFDLYIILFYWQAYWYTFVCLNICMLSHTNVRNYVWFIIEFSFYFRNIFVNMKLHSHWDEIFITNDLIFAVIELCESNILSHSLLSPLYSWTFHINNFKTVMIILILSPHAPTLNLPSFYFFLICMYS